MLRIIPYNDKSRPAPNLKPYWATNKCVIHPVTNTKFKIFQDYLTILWSPWKTAQLPGGTGGGMGLPGPPFPTAHGGGGTTAAAGPAAAGAGTGALLMTLAAGPLGPAGAPWMSLARNIGARSPPWQPKGLTGADSGKPWIYQRLYQRLYSPPKVPGRCLEFREIPGISGSSYLLCWGSHALFGIFGQIRLDMHLSQTAIPPSHLPSKGKFFAAELHKKTSATFSFSNHPTLHVNPRVLIISLGPTGRLQHLHPRMGAFRFYFPLCHDYTFVCHSAIQHQLVTSWKPLCSAPPRVWCAKSVGICIQPLALCPSQGNTTLWHMPGRRICKDSRMRKDDPSVMRSTWQQDPSHPALQSMTWIWLEHTRTTNHVMKRMKHHFYTVETHVPYTSYTIYHHSSLEHQEVTGRPWDNDMTPTSQWCCTQWSHLRRNGLLLSTATAENEIRVPHQQVVAKWQPTKQRIIYWSCLNKASSHWDPHWRLQLSLKTDWHWKRLVWIPLFSPLAWFTVSSNRAHLLTKTLLNCCTVYRNPVLAEWCRAGFGIPTIGAACRPTWSQAFSSQRSYKVTNQVFFWKLSNFATAKHCCQTADGKGFRAFILPSKLRGCGNNSQKVVPPAKSTTLQNLVSQTTCCIPERDQT